MKLPIRHKFHAKPTEFNGRKYASKREAAYAQGLELAIKAGQLLFYLEQVPFRLPGGVTYRVDFEEFWADGTIRFVDVKGMKTPLYITKKKMVEDLYPITIMES